MVEVDFVVSLVRIPIVIWRLVLNLYAHNLANTQGTLSIGAPGLKFYIIGKQLYYEFCPEN